MGIFCMYVFASHTCKLFFFFLEKNYKPGSALEAQIGRSEFKTNLGYLSETLSQTDYLLHLLTCGCLGAEYKSGCRRTVQELIFSCHHVGLRD